MWVWLAALLVAIFVGSNSLKHYDAALVPYTGACVFSAFGIGYRFAMWLRRPPTRKYWFRGWRIFFRPSKLPRNVVRLAQVFFSDFVEQRFIEKRSHTRWAAHWLIAWGCILAAAVTFPLSFGWVHFESAPDNQEIYRAFVFGQHVSTFHLGTITAALTFNILDISAVMVLMGVALALFRRARDRGAISVQQFAQDMMPLLMLFAISITGLFLTASTHLLHGLNYGFLSMLHAVTVIFTLLYLPFGKFFHIFQRPAQIGVQFYKEEGARTEQTACLRCGDAFRVTDAHRRPEGCGELAGNSLPASKWWPLSGRMSRLPAQIACHGPGRKVARTRHALAAASKSAGGIWPNHQ